MAGKWMMVCKVLRLIGSTKSCDIVPTANRGVPSWEVVGAGGGIATVVLTVEATAW
jgi:hypothetical protein